MTRINTTVEGGREDKTCVPVSQGPLRLTPTARWAQLAWTETHSKAAVQEHWDVWFVDDADKSYAEIEYLDVDPGPWTCDADVVAHVALMAVFGSPMHQMALTIEYRSHQAFYDERR